MDSAVMFEKTCSFNEKAAVCEGSETWTKGPKCELVGFDSLPEYLKDNEFILKHYRAEWPLKETLLSVFSVHNETLNIWTHLIGFFIFVALTVFAAAAFRAEDDPIGFESLHSMYNLGYTISLYNASSAAADAGHRLGGSPVARWPFFAFLAGTMGCLLASSACHLLVCHSERCAYKMLRLDYAGISTLIVTSFYPLVYYTFACDPFCCRLYIGFITLFGVGTVLVSLLPAFQTPKYRSLRSLLFACMALSGLVPIAHKVVVFGDRPDAIATAQYEMAMGAFYGIGVAIYAARVPERWLPGRFDLVGHSHQPLLQKGPLIAHL